MAQPTRPRLLVVGISTMTGLARRLAGEPIRLALIGAGAWGANYLTTAPRVPGVSLDIVCDPCAKARVSARELAPRVEAVESLEEVFERGVDGVVVATPPASHVSVATRCFDAGLHVLVEKPLAVEEAGGTRRPGGLRTRRPRLAGGSPDVASPCGREPHRLGPCRRLGSGHGVPRRTDEPWRATLDRVSAVVTRSPRRSDAARVASRSGGHGTDGRERISVRGKPLRSARRRRRG
ncbi:MAG: Gfo/Idh/MocA family oxidoreductase [Polyangiaceae bacterium]|nr:Gfo/Idh/MocA family oxidoreductase [Polyangiaceae bacterium]